MSKLERRVVIVLIVTLFFGYMTVSALNAFNAPEPDIWTTHTPVTVQKEKITPDGLYLAINKIRAKNDLDQFKRNPLLDKSAKLKCNDMVANNYYEHENPKTGKKGYSYISDVGVSAEWVSENLHQAPFNNHAEVITGWMSSQAHKASILDPRYTEIGFAVCEKGDETTVVQHKIEPQEPQQVQSQQAPQSRYDYTRNLYDKPTTTRCTHNESEFFDDTTTCTTY